MGELYRSNALLFSIFRESRFSARLARLRRFLSALCERNKIKILLRWGLETPVSSMVTQGDGGCQGPLLFLLRWGTSAMLLDDFAGPCYHDRSFIFGGFAM